MTPFCTLSRGELSHHVHPVGYVCTLSRGYVIVYTLSVQWEYHRVHSGCTVTISSCTFCLYSDIIIVYTLPVKWQYHRVHFVCTVALSSCTLLLYSESTSMYNRLHSDSIIVYTLAIQLQYHRVHFYCTVTVHRVHSVCTVTLSSCTLWLYSDSICLTWSTSSSSSPSVSSVSPCRGPGELRSLPTKHPESRVLGTSYRVRW